MSIEGAYLLYHPVTDPFGRLLPMQDVFVKENLLVLRMEERGAVDVSCIRWNDTGELIIPLLEQLEKQESVHNYQVRMVVG